MLATAAWWIDDPAACFAAREELFRRRRLAGDDLGAARTAIELAWDATLFRGDRAVARGWAARARSLLADSAPGPERAWLSLRVATLDDAGPAEFTRVRALARELGDVDAEMTAVVLEGSALMAEGRAAEGLARLDEGAAAACAGELEHPVAIVLACCQLLEACGQVADFDRASQWCERVAALCERRNIWSVLNVGRCYYAPILISRGAWDEAERVLLTGESRFREAVPSLAARSRAWLAELRFRQGRVSEARALLDKAEPYLGCRLTRAAIALADDEPEVAAEHAGAFLRQSAEAFGVDRVTALGLLVRAEARRGRTAAAQASLAALEGFAELFDTLPLRAIVLLARAAICEAGEDLVAAGMALSDAADWFERGHAPYEAAIARIELGRVLGAAGRSDDSGRERARGQQRLRELRTKGHGRGVLSEREIEVLQLVADGLSNQQIADRLVLSTHTVHRHVSNVMRKLDASSRAAAVAHASFLGLLR